MKTKIKKFFYPRTTIDTIKSDWPKFKKLLKRSIDLKNINEANRLFELICSIGYYFNFLENFTDFDIEEYLHENFKHFNFDFSDVKENNNKCIIFYDYFTLDYRGYTQQYINYFIENNIEFIYLMLDSNYDEKKEIIQTIQTYKFCKILIVNTRDKTIRENLESIYVSIKNTGVSKIFIHNAPWDIYSYYLCLIFKKLRIKSYLINITDHTYWQGVKIFDYFIDFRKYGVQINHFYRKIPLDKIFLVPTPSFIDDRTKFQGLPLLSRNKVIGFGGGHVSKIRDSKDTYLNLIKKICLDNDNFIFYFANVGDNENYINNFIVKNNLQDRFITLGNRTDICEIFNYIDIYFNTYPYGGGNMIRYAAQNKIPVLDLTRKNLDYAGLHTVIDYCEHLPESLIYDENDYFLCANNLIESKEYRQKWSKNYPSTLEGIELFNLNLNKLLTHESSLNHKSLNHLPVDHQAICNFHFESFESNNTYFTLKLEVYKNDIDFVNNFLVTSINMLRLLKKTLKVFYKRIFLERLLKINLIF